MTYTICKHSDITTAGTLHNTAFLNTLSICCVHKTNIVPMPSHSYNVLKCTLLVHHTGTLPPGHCTVMDTPYTHDYCQVFSVHGFEYIFNCAPLWHRPAAGKQQISYLRSFIDTNDLIGLLKSSRTARCSLIHTLTTDAVRQRLGFTKPQVQGTGLR